MATVDANNPFGVKFRLDAPALAPSAALSPPSSPAPLGDDDDDGDDLPRHECEGAGSPLLLCGHGMYNGWAGLSPSLASGAR